MRVALVHGGVSAMVDVAVVRRARPTGIGSSSGRLHSFVSRSLAGKPPASPLASGPAWADDAQMTPR